MHTCSCPCARHVASRLTAYGIKSWLHTPKPQPPSSSLHLPCSAVQVPALRGHRLTRCAKSASSAATTATSARPRPRNALTSPARRAPSSCSTPSCSPNSPPMCPMRLCTAVDSPTPCSARRRPPAAAHGHRLPRSTLCPPFLPPARPLARLRRHATHAVCEFLPVATEDHQPSGTGDPVPWRSASPMPSAPVTATHGDAYPRSAQANVVGRLLDQGRHAYGCPSSKELGELLGRQIQAHHARTWAASARPLQTAETGVQVPTQRG